MEEVKIETLAVEEGQKYNPETGENAIASLGGYAGDLVFLPTLPESVRPDTHPGAKVRVILEEISKKDSRGHPMYRARPAPDETEEVWELVPASSVPVAAPYTPDNEPCYILVLRATTFSREEVRAITETIWGEYSVSTASDGTGLEIACSDSDCRAKFGTIPIMPGCEIGASALKEALVTIWQEAERVDKGSLSNTEIRLEVGSPGQDYGVLDYERPAPANQAGPSVRKVSIRRNWCFAEVRRETLEERALATRDGASWETSEYALFLEATLADSFVIESKVRIVPEERETVKNCQLLWEKISDRREPVADVQYPVTEVIADSRGGWYNSRLEAVYSADAAVVLSATYQKPDSTTSKQAQNVEWGKLPAWLQDQLVAPYPLCTCGRKRIEEQADGYAKCELCRAEETCERCGKQGKISVIYGKLICDVCQPKAKLELMIDELLDLGKRQAIAREAHALRMGQSFNGAEGIAVLGLALDHISSNSTRDNLFRKWSGYAEYYFTEDGVFGSKFATSSLEFLELLSQAQGNGLVELVAWVVGGAKPGSNDYYLRTQIKGEQGVAPSFTEQNLREILLKLDQNQPVLADRLRGSEAERQQALRLLAEIEEEVGDSRIISLDEARRLLQAEEQNYGGAVRKLVETREYIDGEMRLGMLLDRDYPLCALCGEPWRNRDDEEIAPHAGASCDHHEYTDKGGDGEFPILRTCDAGGNVLIEAVVSGHYHPYYPSRPLCEIRVHKQKIPDLATVKTERLMSLPQFDHARRELAKDANLAEELARCEGTYPTRVKATFVANRDPKRPSQLDADVELPERDGGWQFEYSDREYSVSTVRLVCDPSRCSWLGEERPKANETWVCSVGKMIGIHHGHPIILANPQVRVPAELAGSSLEPVPPSDPVGDGEEPDISALASAWGARVK